jgi:hypothetical protein
MKFADVTNDIAFRKIFGNENKKQSLASFLNAVIYLLENNKVVDVEITKPYQHCFTFILSLNPVPSPIWKSIHFLSRVVH